MTPDNFVIEATPHVPATLIGAKRWLVPARVDQPELLDLGEGSSDEVKRSLDDLWRINRYLWGISALTRHLFPRLGALDSAAVCVDLGAGAAQVSGAIAEWSRHEGRDVKVVGLDFAMRNLHVAQQYAQRSGVRLLMADAMQLPFAPASVDYVISSLFLHHFTPDQVILLLRAANRCARRGVVMADIVRGWLPLAAFKLIQPVFARSYITRYDGAVSIRRAYTPPELLAMAQAAGLQNPRVYTHCSWRMTLVADK